jgi:hypothetical protein
MCVFLALQEYIEMRHCEKGMGRWFFSILWENLSFFSIAAIDTTLSTAFWCRWGAKSKIPFFHDAICLVGSVIFLMPTESLDFHCSVMGGSLF